MRLDDIIRESTQEILDAVRLVEKEKTRFQQMKDAADERIKRYSTDIPSDRTLLGDKKHRIRDLEEKVRELNGQIEELERKKQDLYDRWTERNKELEDEKKAIGIIETKIDGIQREISRENQGKTHADNEINKIENERIRHEGKLTLAYINAFSSYVMQTNQALTEFFRESSEKISFIHAAENLKKMRHEDKETAELCEAREEWIKILRTASVPAVKTTGESELRRIEAEIDKKFPGALKSEASKSLSSSESYLYYFIDDEDAGTNEGIIFIPFLKKDWMLLTTEDKSISNRVFAYFLWWISRESKVDPQEVHFDCRGEFVVMAFKFGLGDLYGKNHVIMDLPGNTSVTFILSEIPNEIYRAMTYEKITS